MVLRAGYARAAHRAQSYRRARNMFVHRNIAAPD
jgi:hypothetical protein